MAVRVTLLLKKLDTLTDEEFAQHVDGQHTDLILKCPIVLEKVLKVSRFHVDQALYSAMAATGLPTSEFDGEFSFWCASMEDWMAVISDPGWLNTVVADGAKFNKQQEGRVMIGYDNDFIADAKLL